MLKLRPQLQPCQGGAPTATPWPARDDDQVGGASRLKGSRHVGPAAGRRVEALAVFADDFGDLVVRLLDSLDPRVDQLPRLIDRVDPARCGCRRQHHDCCDSTRGASGSRHTRRSIRTCARSAAWRRSRLRSPIGPGPLLMAWAAASSRSLTAFGRPESQRRSDGGMASPSLIEASASARTAAGKCRPDSDRPYRASWRVLRGGSGGAHGLRYGIEPGGGTRPEGCGGAPRWPLPTALVWTPAGPSVRRTGLRGRPARAAADSGADARRSGISPL